MSATHFSGPVAVGSGKMESVGATKTVSSADNGKVLVLNGGTGGAIALPAVATALSGLQFKIVVGAAFSTDYVITATTAVISGPIAEAGVIQTCAGATTLTLEDGTEAIGDHIDFLCDGTNWLINGNFQTAASITVA